MKNEATDNIGLADVPQTPTKKGVTPSKSSYIGAMYKLEFADKLVTEVPRGVIDKYPAFAEHFTDRRIDLTELNGRQAHILVHYLYTGSYQHLETEADSSEEKCNKAFAESLRVHSAAVENDLDHLAVLAAQELTKLGEGLTFPKILRIIEREDHHCLGEIETWLLEYLVKRAERYSENGRNRG